MKTKDTSVELATKLANLLREIGQEIWREKELLSFMRFCEHLSKNLVTSFRCREYVLKRCAFPRTSLHLSLADRVFAIKIFDKFIDDGEGGIKINRVELLLQRGTHCILWLILKEDFSQKLNLLHPFYSTGSEIIYSSSPSDLIANLANIDFDNGISDLSALKNGMCDWVTSCVSAWIRESIERKEGSLKRLRKFKKDFDRLSNIVTE